MLSKTYTKATYPFNSNPPKNPSYPHVLRSYRLPTLHHSTNKNHHPPQILHHSSPIQRNPTNQPTKPEQSNSRLWQLKGRSPLALEHPVDEDPVLAVAGHEEVRLVVVDLQVPPGYETRVAHVDVDLALAAVPADGDAPLAHHVLELPALEPGYRGALGLGQVPLHPRRAGRGRFQGEQGPGVALLCPRVRRHLVLRAAAATVLSGTSRCRGRRRLGSRHGDSGDGSCVHTCTRVHVKLTPP